MDCATARPDLIHAKPNSAYHMRGGRGVAGGLCYWTCTSLKHRFNYDDSLDVFGVHGVGGMTGTLLCGVFATASICGTAGLIEGHVTSIIPLPLCVRDRQYFV